MESIQDYQKDQEQYQSIKPPIKKPILLFNSFVTTLIIYFFVGSLSLPIFTLFDTSGKETTISIVVITTILFFIIVFIVFLIKKTALKRTEYKFYSNKVEYFDGFLVKNRKTINYDRITNIGQRKGIIEEQFGLGTIFIDTASGRELSMKGLENPDQTYDWISNITNQKRQPKE